MIQACSVPDRLTHQEFAEAARLALGAPSSGVIVFSQRHFVREGRGATWRALVNPKGVRGGGR